jgi:hypothetical protein
MPVVKPTVTTRAASASSLSPLSVPLSSVREEVIREEGKVESSSSSFSPSSALDTGPSPLQLEEERLLAESAAVEKETAALLRVEGLRRKLEEQKALLASLHLASSASSSSSSLSSSTVPSTPARGLTPVNRSLFTPSSVSGYNVASSVTAAKKQAIDSLPFSSSSSSLHPSSPPFSSSVKRTPPAKFTGEMESVNAGVEQWVDEANTYFDLSRIPFSERLAEAKGLCSGYALKWWREKNEEVEAAGRVMTWDWLQAQLIDDFGRSSGVAAQQAEWIALRMGVENADGTRKGGKSTYTVKDYTSQFTRLMRSLTSHTLQTTDLLVIDRYLQGIKLGYSALYNEMRGMHTLLHYDSLATAITGAQVAETALSAGKIASSSSYRSSRHSSTQANNMQTDGETDDEGFTPASSSRGKTKKPQLNGFVYRPITEEGRFKTTEAQQKWLYDHHRCYRCYQEHDKLGKCGKKMSSPPSLN